MAFGDLVQSIKTNSSDGASSISATFDDTPTEGNRVVCWYMTGDGNGNKPTTGVGAWIEGVNPKNGTESDDCSIFSQIAGASEAKTVTCTSDSSDECAICIAEFEGPHDPTADLSNDDGRQASGTNYTCTGGGTTSQADELACAITYVRSDTGAVYDSWNSFTTAASLATAYKSLLGAYKVLTATGTISENVDWSGGNSVPAQGGIVTFKKAAAGDVGNLTTAAITTAAQTLQGVSTEHNVGNLTTAAITTAAQALQGVSTDPDIGNLTTAAITTAAQTLQGVSTEHNVGNLTTAAITTAAQALQGVSTDPDIGNLTTAAITLAAQALQGVNTVDISNFYLRRRHYARKPGRDGAVRLDRQHPLLMHCVAVWPFLEGSGLAARDWLGNSHAIEAGSAGNTSWDGLGWKIDADGADTRLDLGSITSTHPLSCSANNAASVVARLKPNAALNSTWPRIIDKSSGGSAADGWAFYLSGNDSVSFEVAGTSSNSGTISDMRGLAATVGVSAASGSIRFFHNGAFVVEQTDTWTISSTSTNAAIGNWNHSTDRDLSGRLDIVYVFDRKISDQHQRALALNPWAPFYRMQFMPTAANDAVTNYYRFLLAGEDL